MAAVVFGLPIPPEREPPRRPTDPQALKWRARIEAMSPDKDPCPGYRHGKWARVRAAILETLDRFGDELVRLGCPFIEDSVLSLGQRHAPRDPR